MCFVDSGTTVTPVPALQSLVQTVSGPGGNMIPATTANIDATVNRINTARGGGETTAQTNTPQQKATSTDSGVGGSSLLTSGFGFAKKTLLGT